MRTLWALLVAVLLAVAAGLCYLLIQKMPKPPATAVQAPAPPLDVAGYAPAGLPEGPPPGADAIVFDMAYRGLAGGKGDLRYNSYWGFGGSSDPENAFLKAVRKTAGKVEPVYNPNFKGAEWAAVELRRNQPIALYFDLNADGELADFEKILPLGKPDQFDHVEFITPDFLMTTPEGAQTPFRVLVQAREGGFCMWSPSCILEGSAKMNGRDVDLLLFADDFSGSFIDFGGCSYALKDCAAETGQYVPRQPLSSLISQDDLFYTFRFLKHPDKPGLIRAVIEKDTTPTGQLAVRLAGQDNIKARLNNANISGVADGTIRLSVSGAQTMTLPQGEYRLDRGYIYYGVENAYERFVDFTNGPVVKIVADETLTVDLGKPRMIVSAIDQAVRDQSDAVDTFTYRKGTVVFLSPRIEGLAAERYGRFTADPSSGRVDVVPTFEILDSAGKQVASGKMEYG
jgi:hypothetical protein